MTESIKCPHCGAPNGGAGAFCESCGKALPAALPGGPRVVASAEFASTSAGQKLQADELHGQAKKASGALLIVAVIQTIVGGIMVVALSQIRGGNTSQIGVLATVAAGVAIVFWGLYVWSRSQPLPAAIVGLVAYATLMALNVIVSISRMSAQGGQPNGGGFGGIGIGWLDIVIMIILARAISAGVKYRQMQRGV